MIKNKAKYIVGSLCVGLLVGGGLAGCGPTSEQKESLQPVTPPPRGATIPPPLPGAANDSRFNPNSPANGGNRPR